MSTILMWTCFTIGLLGTASAILMSRLTPAKDEPVFDQSLRRALIVTSLATAGVSLLLFLATLPVIPPFASGQRLGIGFLLGGIVSAVAGPLMLWLFLRGRREESSWQASSTGIAAGSLALLGISALLLIFKGYPQPALIGYAMASVMSVVLFRLGVADLPTVRERLADTATADGFLGLEYYALISTTLSAGTVLTFARFSETAMKHWWYSGLLLFATVCLTAIIATSLSSFGRYSRNPGKSYAMSMLIASLILIGVTALFSAKLFTSWELLSLTILGVISIILALWLSTYVTGASGRAPALETAVIIILVLIASGLVAFRVMAGYGMSIALLAGCLPALLSFGLFRPSGNDGEQRTSILPVSAYLFLSTGLGILLYRLFITYYSQDMRGTDLRTQYSFAGMLLGTIAPFMIGSVMLRLRADWLILPLRLISAGTLGLLSVASPILVLLIWGLRAELGYVTGLVAAEVFMLLMFYMCGCSKKDSNPITSLKMSALVTGMLLSALQFTQPFMQFMDMTRVHKAYILAGAFVIGAMVVAGSWLVSRRIRGIS